MNFAQKKIRKIQLLSNYKLLINNFFKINSKVNNPIKTIIRIKVLILLIINKTNK